MKVYTAWCSRCYNKFELGTFSDKETAQATIDMYRYKFREEDTHHYGFDSGIYVINVHTDIPKKYIELKRKNKE